MKKPILVIQFRKPPTLEHEQECIANSMQMRADNFVFTNIADDNPYIPAAEEISKYSAVIIGGSSEYNITNWPKDLEDKARQLVPFLKQVIESDLPTLGICFGHQLIAHYFGGKVERDVTQAEGGIVKTKILQNGTVGKIFNDMPHEVLMATGHKDSVTKLPNNAVLLAKTDKNANNAYKLKDNIYCVQFHPELDVDALIWRMSLFPEYRRGRSLEEIRSEYQDMPYTSTLFKNFKDVINQA